MLIRLQQTLFFLLFIFISKPLHSTPKINYIPAKYFTFTKQKMADLLPQRALQTQDRPETPPCLIPGDPDRIEEIKEAVQNIFPVLYSSDFYRKLFSKDTFLQLLCSPEDEKIVGLVAIRLSTVYALELHKDVRNTPNKCTCELEGTEENDKIIYVILLGVLEKHRGSGYGRLLLKEVESISVAYGIRHILLHVQTSNLRAIDFYYKSGFMLVKLMQNYYNNVYPKDAFLLRKCLYSQ